MKQDQLFNFLAESTAVPALPGFEREGCSVVADWFRAYTKDVTSDNFGSVYARMGGEGTAVYVAAHMDGLGLMVRSIEEDGFLGVTQLGGFDHRTLLAKEVTVHGKSADFYGIIGAKPPHVLTQKEQGNVLELTELYVDVGMDAERVRTSISIGDLVSLNSPLMHLEGDVVAGRALDNRAGIAVMLEAMRRLHKKPPHAQVIFCATAQEEVGGLGAKTTAFHLNPDMAIAVDVTHAHTPGAPKSRTVDYDKPSISKGVVIDRRMAAKFCAIAKKRDIPYCVEVNHARTGTDADSTVRVRDGIPTAILGIPLKYMHTSVECIKLESVNRCGKLLAAFIRAVDEDWEEWPCD